MKTMKQLLLVAVAGVALTLTTARAAVYNINNGNSSAVIDTTYGMYNWLVDGDSILYRQWFWYRIGDTAPNESISTLTLDTSRSGVSPSGRVAEVVFMGNGFEIDVLYTITGGSPGSGTADIAETIRIQNINGRTLNFRFFQYSDFDLSPNLADWGALVNANTVAISGSQGYLTETVATPAPSRWEIDNWYTLVNQIEGGAYNLSNNVDQNNDDIAWAFQWDVSIAPGQTFIISKDKNFRRVPDAGATVAMLGLAMAGLAMMRRRFVR